MRDHLLWSLGHPLSRRKAGDLAYKNNFAQLRDYLPRLERCLLALMDDLRERGLEQDVSVVVWGEMGRTPRINANGGRDHWPQVAGCILAGGGMQTGQVIGSTNRFAEVAQDRPVHYPAGLCHAVSTAWARAFGTSRCRISTDDRSTWSNIAT
ncbi:MAG: hypothetical protein Ct9H300mP1_29530 [Planctomycetaceae bacterium]|nr:MAG: hypothetical protein Ct9H300mP1_29530 [Planctomycetaceae bacterium]